MYRIALAASIYNIQLIKQQQMVWQPLQMCLLVLLVLMAAQLARLTITPFLMFQYIVLVVQTAIHTIHQLKFVIVLTKT